mgnify:CR=1 FL=1
MIVYTTSNPDGITVCWALPEPHGQRLTLERLDVDRLRGRHGAEYLDTAMSMLSKSVSGLSDMLGSAAVNVEHPALCPRKCGELRDLIREKPTISLDDQTLSHLSAVDEAEEVANDVAGLRMKERLTTPAKREASKAQALPPKILSDLLHDIEAHKAAPKVDLPSVSVATPVFCRDVLGDVTGEVLPPMPRRGAL